MKISMVAIGSMGDVKPYTVLAQELIRRGHQPRLIAFAPFEDLARKTGMDFMALPGNLHYYMSNLMKPGNNVLTFLPELDKSLASCKDAIMDTLLAGCSDADLILTTFSMAAVYSIAEKLKVPCIQTHYYPMDPNEDFPMFLFPQRGGRRFAEATYKMSWIVVNMFERRALTDWRREQGVEQPKLKPAPMMRIGEHRIPVVYAISSLLLNRPSDWDDRIYMSGFWQSEPPADYHAPESLEAFLNAGEPPVYLGFGSMVSGDMEKFFSVVLEALEQTGIRAILDGGSSTDKLPVIHSPHIYLNTEFVEHSWLFSRVRCVVHHGGVGTTATGLYAGRPTLIISFGGDQPFWGLQVYQRGLGPKHIPRSQLTVEKLCAALRDLYCNQRYYDAARAMAAQLIREDGVRNAVDIIEKETARWIAADKRVGARVR